MISVAVILLIIYLIFAPEIFPRCSHCGKIKPRSAFLFHITTSMRLSRRGNLSLCKKCCEKEGFTSVARFKKFADAQKRASIYVKWTL